MKIQLLDEKGNLIKSSNCPMDVVIRPEAKIVELTTTDGPNPKKYEFVLVERKVEWLKIPNNDSEEVFVEIKVKSHNG